MFFPHDFLSPLKTGIYFFSGQSTGIKCQTAERKIRSPGYRHYQHQKNS